MERWSGAQYSKTPSAQSLAPASMIFLQGLHAIAALLQRRDPKRRRPGPAERRHDRRVGINRRRADSHLVGARHLTRRRVDDEMDFAVLEQVKRVGPDRKSV